MTRPRPLLAPLLLTLGCGAQPSPGPRPPAPPAASVPAARAQSEPRIVPGQQAPPAPWLRPALAEPRPSPDPEVVARGQHALVAKLGSQYFAADDRQGVIGPLALPAEATWVGLDGDDALYAATGGGRLVRASSLASARRADGFEARAEVPGATAWDAASGLVVAAAPDGVAVSVDGGAKFRRALSSRSFVPARVFARSDGVIVAQSDAGKAGAETRVSRDRGGTWARPSYQPREPIAREGGFVFAAGTCVAAIDREGRSFRVALADRAGLEPLTRMLRASSSAEARGPEPHDGLDLPAPPPSTEAPMVEGLACLLSRPPPAEREGRPVSQASPCALGGCLRGTAEAEPALTAAEFGLLQDGACAAADADEKHRCRPDAPLSRKPHLAVRSGDPPRLAVKAAPEGCRPERVFAAGGAGVLFCAPQAAGGSAVHLLDEQGEAHAEGSLALVPGEVQRLAMAPDGTLLVRAAWGSPGRRAFVRAPLPLGEAGAWREIALGDALELRVASGGGVVIASAEGPEASRLRFTLDRPAQPPLLLGDGVAAGGHVVDLSLEHGRLVVWRLAEIHRGRVAPGAPAARGGALPFYLTTEGVLAPDLAALLP